MQSPKTFKAYQTIILSVLIFTFACQSNLESTQTITTESIIANTIPQKTSPHHNPIKTKKPTFTQEPSQSPTLSSTPTTMFNTSTPTPTDIPLITLLFTGVIVPARCVQAALDEIGNPDYPYEEVSDLINEADLAVGTFNATMSDKVEHTGCLTTWQLVGSPDNADALQRAGFDAMSVATNHIKDCGLMKSWCDYTFFDTLFHLDRVGIKTVGAGEDLEAALEAIIFDIKGVRFGIVSLGDSKMSETVFAGEDHPGIAHLTEENIKIALEAARNRADVVIAMPHWGSEDITIPNWIQREQAQILVREGADLVVGNHTHVVQAIQTIDQIPVFYGLGNFVFDQGLRDHRQGAILLVKFSGTNYIGYEMIPTHVDPDGRVHIADEEEAAEILQRVDEASDYIR
jgi:poly-gamma-glutamate capsule biosynthesis protein CapA/YwtB (metallophosphatase superfamily)